MTKGSPRIGICGFCGLSREITDDHIPPKNIFPKPRTNDLITTPCCEECRKGWSMDDEYFRTAIYTFDPVHAHPAATKISNKIVSSLNKPNKQGYANLVMNSFKEIEVYSSEGGIYLGTQTVFHLDAERFNRVATRIVRGLFFNHKKYIVPKTHEVLANIPLKDINDLLDKVPFSPIKSVGNSVFSYRYCFADDDPDYSIWLMVFNNALPVIGKTRLRKEIQ